MQCKFIVEVARDETVYQVEVRCYDSNESLNAARQKYERETTGEVDAEPVRAITHSFSSESIQSGGSSRRGQLCNIIRIDDTAGAAITSHELLHAACHIYRQHYGNLELLEGYMEDEERLCHLHSDLVYATTNKLIELGVWK